METQVAREGRWWLRRRGDRPVPESGDRRGEQHHVEAGNVLTPIVPHHDGTPTPAGSARPVPYRDCDVCVGAKGGVPITRGRPRPLLHLR